MSEPRLRGAVVVGSLMVVLATAACGCVSADVDHPNAPATASASLTAADVTTARTHGLLTSQLIVPAWITGTGSLPGAQAYGINNAGTVVGFFDEATGPPWVAGQNATAFSFDGSSTTELTMSGTSPRVYATGVSDGADIVAIGGPAASWYRAVRYRSGTPTSLFAEASEADVVTAGGRIGGSIKASGGAVMRWRFEATGTGVGQDIGKDDLGIAHLGSQTGGTLPSATGREGVRAMHFDGTSLGAYAAATTASDVTNRRGFTLMTWVKAASCQSAAVPLVQRGRQFGVGLRCVNGTVKVTGFVNFDGNTDSVQASSDAYGTVPTDTWTHVAMTWDRGYVKYFVNGQRVGKRSASGTVVGSNAWILVGYDDHVSAYFSGDVDDASLWMEPVADAQVGQFYRDKGNYAQYSNVSRWYRYDDDDATEPALTVMPSPVGTAYTGEGYLYGVDDLGDAVGYHLRTDGSRVATVYTEEDGTQALNDLHPAAEDGWDLQFATAVANTGTTARRVVGFGTRGTRRVGFMFDLDTHEIVEISSTDSPFDGTAGNIVPRAMNARGEVVGTAVDGGGWPVRAFHFSRETGLTDLNAFIDSSSWTLREARAINDRGQVAGYATGTSAGVNGTKRAYRLNLPGIPSQEAVACAGGQACTTAFPIAFTLAAAARVSIGIFKADGTQVRELAHAAPTTAGDHIWFWDGRDNQGQLVTGGTFTWRLLGTPNGLSAQFLYKLGDNYPVPETVTGVATSGPGPHTNPSALAVDSGGLYVGAREAEGWSAIVKVSTNRATRLWEKSGLGWAGHGPLSLALYDQKLYALGWHDSTSTATLVQSVYVLDPSDGTGSTVIDVHDGDGAFAASDMDVGDGASLGDGGTTGEIVVSYAYHDAANASNDLKRLKWFGTSGQSSPLTLDLVDYPGGVALYQGDTYVTMGASVWVVTGHGQPQRLTALNDPHLQQPARLFVESGTGDVVVYDKGTKQVKRFAGLHPHTSSPASCSATAGEFCEAYGRAGGRADGAYDASDFKGMTDLVSDHAGGYWVAEAYGAPRRVAHFAAGQSQPEGKELYGPQPFYSDGQFDPDDSSDMWISSADGEAPGTKYLMKVRVSSSGSAGSDWQVTATYKYVDTAQNPDVNDGPGIGGFRVFRHPTSGLKYLVTTWPSIFLIDEAQKSLRPVASLPESTKGWKDLNGDGVVNSGERYDVLSAPTAYHGSFIDDKLDLYTVSLPSAVEPCRIYKTHATSFTTAGVPTYSDAAPYAACSAPAVLGGNDGRWFSFLYHANVDSSTDELYAGYSSGLIGFGVASGAFVQRYSTGGGASWAVGHLAPVHLGGSPPSTVPPGQIRGTLRGFAGRVNGRGVDQTAIPTIVAFDSMAESTPGEGRAFTYVWTTDGLFVGGLMDEIVGAASAWYSNGDDQTRGAVAQPSANSVLYAAGAYGHTRVFKITGWTDWIRSSGTFSFAPPTGAGTGLTGTYFDDAALTQQKTTRVDGPIDFAWADSIPAGTTLTAATDYGVRWSGSIAADYGPKYSGFWRQRHDGGTGHPDFRDAPSTGASVSVRFRGTSIAVFGFLSSTYGSADIYLDDQLWHEAQSWKTTGDPFYGEVFHISELTDGAHTLEIRTHRSPMGEQLEWVNVDMFRASTGDIEDDGLLHVLYVVAPSAPTLKIGGAAVTWQAGSQGPEWATTPIPLLRDAAPIELTVQKSTQSATAALKWSSAYAQKQLVPKSALFPQ